MSYITDLPSGGSWFDTTAEGWYLQGIPFEQTLKGEGFDHVDNGPYGLNPEGLFGTVDIGRTFVCDGDLLYHFDFCHMDFREQDAFSVYGSVYTEDNPFPLSTYLKESMEEQYNSDNSFRDLGITLPEEDQLNEWKKEHYSQDSFDYSWKCKSVADSMVSSTAHIGYHIAMHLFTESGDGVFAIRDFIARCIPNTIPYNIFALSDPSDSIVFGFQTGPDNTPKASKATVVIDLYGDKGSDILRCYLFGVNPSTSYVCYSRGDNVYPISADYNTDNLENKLIIRAFEHGGMDILIAFIGSAELMSESASNVASAGLPQESQHVSSNTLLVKFALTKSDTETTIVFEASSVDPYSINGIDAEYGTIKETYASSVGEVSVDFEWNYDPDGGDCMWNPAVDESINAVNEESGPGAWDFLDTAGSVSAVLGDIAEITKYSSIAFGFGAASNVIGLTGSIGGLFGAGEDSTAELTQDALKDLKDGTEEMIECNQRVAAEKMNALKDAVNAALEQLQGNIEAQNLEAEYATHREDVQREIAGLEDTVDALQLQWRYIDTITDNDEILAELQNILDNTMGRFGTVIIKKPSGDDFDYFWRLYSKEMTLSIPEILTLRFNIWMMWLSYNGISDESDNSIKDIEPDFRRGFRDLTGELIGEYMHLLPMAILTIMKQEYGFSELQPMTVTDRFREIELRFQPALICGWMTLARALTDTEDTYFLGDYKDLYDDNIDECASNVRVHIIKEVVQVDNDRVDDTEIIFGKELDADHTHNVHIYDYDYSDYGCSYDYPESLDCHYAIPTTSDHDKGILTDIEGFLQVHSVRLVTSNKEDVAPSIIEMNTDPNSDTLTNDVAAKGDVKLDISCSDQYRISGMRFGTVVYENPSSSKDRYETIALKLLCRPIPQSEQDLYDTFTDYEIISKIPEDNMNENEVEGEVSWDEWKSCPIGKYIKTLVYIWNQETDPVFVSVYHSLDTPRFWEFFIGITCYDGDQEHTYYSLLNDADVVFPLFDIYPNSYKPDHFWIWMVLSMVLLMVLALMQWWFCLYKRQKATKRIVHFDQETSDDENVV